MFTYPLRSCHNAVQFGLAVIGLLVLAPSSARAQNGTPGTPGTNGATLAGSFTLSDPNAVYHGTDGGAGGPASSGGYPFGFSGGTGGTGGTGLVATGASANITILGGSFSGGAGGVGGQESQGIAGGRPGTSTGGKGGDGFAATGAGDTIAILGGNFSGGRGGDASPDGRGTGGDSGNAFSAGPGVTASIYGGSFPPSLNGGSGFFATGLRSYSFFVNGGNVTLYGTFMTFTGASLTGTTVTNTSEASCLGTFANNTGPAVGYIYRITNGGTITFAAPVPEASTTVSFGLLLILGLSGLLVAARRKKAA